MNIMITGARAPAALQLARILGRAGHDIILVDSFQHCAAYHSSLIKGHHVLPSPALNFTSFVLEAKAALLRFNPQYVICTCEDIFYWAKAAELYPQEFQAYRAANPTFQQLHLLHHKGHFARWASAIAEKSGVHIPETYRFGSIPDEGPWVCKPSYSRFAVSTQLHQTQNQAQQHIQNKAWIAQRQIQGTEYCSWGYYVQGQEVCHVTYEPQYRAGLGAGIGLQSVANLHKTRIFAQQLATQLHYTGQLAFDWILSKQDLYVLECNPRSTSGVHFLDHCSQIISIRLLRALQGNTAPLLPLHEFPLESIAFPWAFCVFFGTQMLHPFQGAELRGFLQKARNAETALDDPRPQSPWVQLQALHEMSSIAQQKHLTLQAASTYDLEWNGYPFWDSLS